MRRLILTLAALVPIVVTPGDPIPDIDVTVEQIPGGPRMQTHTGADGAFSFALAPGTYLLRVGSRPVPNGTTTPERASRAPGTLNGRLIPLPASVSARGGWPYALRIVDAGLSVERITTAAPAANQRMVGPAANDLEVRFTIAASAKGTSAPVTLRGGVEARN